jgi:hypothetical protein
MARDENKFLLGNRNQSLNTSVLKEATTFTEKSRNFHVNLKREEFESLDFMKI